MGGSDLLDEMDLSQEKEWLYRERAEIAVTNLQKRNINAQYVSERQEALSIILGMIPEGVTVVRGDSVTLEQIGVVAALRKRHKNNFIDPFETKPDGSWLTEREERLGMMRQAFLCDVFVTGTNAVTLDGKLVNTDGLGNRVAPMLFGPEKVIVVTGINKIVKDVNEAMERIHGVAAPMNAMRHFLKHHFVEFSDLPCVATGKCVDCSHERRICRYNVIIEGTSSRQKGRINVVLIGEELGI